MPQDLSKFSDEELEAIVSKGPSVPPPKRKLDPAQMSDAELTRIVLAGKDGKPEPEVSKGRSALSGITQGLTFGYSDEIIGGLQAGVKKALGDERPFAEVYEAQRDAYRAYRDRGKADNPKTFLGGAIAGGVGSVAAAPVFGAAKGAGLAANATRAAAGGALTGAGLSENNPLKSPKEAEKFGKDVLEGAITGAVFQGGFQGIGSVLKKLSPQNLRGFAEIRALKAAGAMKKDFNALQKKGIEHEVGRALLDKKIVKAFSSLDEIAEATSEAKKEAGKKIGDALGKVDDLVAEAEGLISQGKLFGFLKGRDGRIIANGVALTPDQAKQILRDTYQFNMKRVGDRIIDEVVEPNLDNPLVRGEMKKLFAIAKDFQQIPTATLKRANQIKGTQGKLTKFDSDTIPNSFKQEVYDIIKTEIDDIVSKVDNIEDLVLKGRISFEDIVAANISGPSQKAKQSVARAAFEDAKKAYRSLKEAESITLDRLGAEKSNRQFGLTDTIAGVGGLAAGGVPGGIALGVLNKAARKWGASIQASGADKLANILQSAPERLGPFGAALDLAAKNGAKSVIATHLKLMKDPNYQRIIEQQQNQNQGFQLPTPGLGGR